MNEIQRAASRLNFEAWAEPQGHSMVRNGEDYRFASAQCAWAAWQAALATRQPHGIPEGVQRDAERYRWLRDVAHPDSEDGIAVGREAMNSWGNWFTEYLDGESMDVIIDAAMAAAPSPERQG